MNALGPFDYAYIPRAGTTVAYFNAGYVLALRLGWRSPGSARARRP